MSHDTARVHKAPTMHRVYSVSGRTKGKRMGYDDKGSGRNSSRGRMHARGGRFR